MHELKISSVAAGADVVTFSDGRKSDLIRIEQTIDGERHDFFLLARDFATGKRKTRSQIIAEYREFVAERMGVSQEDIKVAGVSHFDKLRLREL